MLLMALTQPSCPASTRLTMEVNAAAIDSLLSRVSAQLCTMDEVGPRVVKAIGRVLPRQLRLTGLVALSSGFPFNMTFELGDHLDGGSNHLMMLPATSEDETTGGGRMHRSGVIGRLSSVRGTLGWGLQGQCLQGHAHRKQICNQLLSELRSNLQLRDVVGWPSALAAGCAVTHVSSDCAVLQLMEVQERRLTESQLHQILRSDQLLPLCRKRGLGHLQCHLNRLQASLVHFEQLTEGDHHRVVLLEHLQSAGRVNDVGVCNKFKIGQMCFSPRDGGAGICDTDHVDPLLPGLPQGGDAGGAEERRQRRHAQPKKDDVDYGHESIPSAATAASWWRAGLEWPVRVVLGKGDQLNALPNYDLPCAFVESFIRPLVPLLPNLSTIADDVEARHAAFAQLFQGTTGATVPSLAAARGVPRQLSFACLRGRLRELMPYAKEYDAQFRNTNRGYRYLHLRA